jgi:hypothetical protein
MNPIAGAPSNILGTAAGTVEAVYADGLHNGKCGCGHKIVSNLVEPVFSVWLAAARGLLGSLWSSRSVAASGLDCRLPRPGDMLHVLILRWVGQRPAAGCQCRQRIVLMNKWGPAGCREHFNEIMGWLVEQAKEHKWLATTIDAAGNEILSETSPPKIVRLTRWMMRSIPGGTIPVVVVCRQMVLAAIRKATQRRGQLRPED